MAAHCQLYQARTICARLSISIYVVWVWETYTRVVVFIGCVMVQNTYPPGYALYISRLHLSLYLRLNAFKLYKLPPNVQERLEFTPS